MRAPINSEVPMSYSCPASIICWRTFSIPCAAVSLPRARVIPAIIGLKTRSLNGCSSSISSIEPGRSAKFARRASMDTALRLGRPSRETDQTPPARSIQVLHIELSVPQLTSVLWHGQGSGRAGIGQSYTSMFKILRIIMKPANTRTHHILA